MKKWLGFILFCLLGSVAPFGAEGKGKGSSETDRAVEFIIRQVEQSDAIFIRNGREHKAADAARLLRAKFKNHRDEIKTPEDFIRVAGTKSSMSGKPYSVKDRGGEKPAAEWLKNHLEKYRKEASEKVP